MVHGLLGLAGKVKVDTLDPVAASGRWHFANGARNRFGAKTLDGVRDTLDGGEGLAATPPYLVDTETNRIVSGRADEIVRMLCTTYSGGGRPDLWPEAKRVRIDELTSRIEERLARPLFAGGLAAGPETQAAERRTVAMSLQFFETMLADRRFLLGDRAGLADLALYACLVRLDAVTRLLWGEPGPALEDFPGLLRFVQDMHKNGRVAHTMRPGILLRHYRQSYGQASRSRMRPTALMLETLYSGRKRRFF
jgi:putative glutathione S-transferase